MFPFNSIPDYPTMLNRIALFNFFAGLTLILILNYKIDEVNGVLKLLPEIIIYDNKIPLLAVLLAFVIAYMSRLFRLHDKISDLFRIRYLYDILIIILPIINELNLSKKENITKYVFNNRKQVMRNIFYKYASADPAKCKIDYNLIIMALTQFTFFWTTIECICLIIPAMLISYMYDNTRLGNLLLFVLFILLVVSVIAILLCKRETTAEIKAILTDNNNRNEITAYINGI